MLIENLVGQGGPQRYPPSTDPLLGLYILVLQGHRYNKRDNEGQSLSDSGMLRFGSSVLKLLVCITKKIAQV